MTDLSTTDTVQLSPRLADAFAVALRLHASQYRKGARIPYLGHLMGVASLVIEDGGDEHEVIAALLHDAVEDQGGPPTLAAIREQFGDQVADIVEACSDTDEQPKPPWHARKQAYIDHLENADSAVLRVSLADKLHNARALLLDFRTFGQELWVRFAVGSTDQLWYYNSLADVLERRHPGPHADELRRVVRDLGRLVEAPRERGAPSRVSLS